MNYDFFVGFVLAFYSFPTSFSLQVDLKVAFRRCMQQKNTYRDSFQNYPNYCSSRSAMLHEIFLLTFH